MVIPWQYYKNGIAHKMFGNIKSLQDYVLRTLLEYLTKYFNHLDSPI